MEALDPMSVVLRQFKTISCTRGNACDNIDCPFRHPREAEPVPPRPEVTAGTIPTNLSPPRAITATTTTLPGGHAGEGSRKRLRLDESGHSILPREAGQEVKKGAEVTTARKPVSPPPLRRKTPSQPPTKSQPAVEDSPPVLTPVKKASPPRGGTIGTGTVVTPLTTLASVNPTPVTPPSTAPFTTKQSPVKSKQPRKVETLNPRHLNHSPAAHTFRYKALHLLHDQLTRLNNELKKDTTAVEEKLILASNELIWLALDEEEKAATDRPAIYQSVIQNRIMSYRRMKVGKWKEERQAVLKKEIEAQTPVKKPFLGPARVIKTGLTADQEVTFLQILLTPIKDLAAFKYVSVAPTDDEVAKARLAEFDSKGWEVCDRCGTRFQIFPGRREEDGRLTSTGTCTYHSGKKFYAPRSATATSGPPQQWTCCSETVGDSAGCTTCATHVFKTVDPKRLAAFMPFTDTPENPTAPKDRAVCFDCEMCYTVKGLELVRVTATSWPDGAELLDVLVKPIGEILDLNSRYSGVWPEDMVNAKPYVDPNDESGSEDEVAAGSQQVSDVKDGEIVEQPLDPNKQKRKRMIIVPSPIVARDLFFKLISPGTPLIGHGLENDLNIMRIIHPTIIDTILLFPHVRGLPFRYSLKALMETYLNRAIQVESGSKAMGHDSAEDARAAGELVRYKVQKEWRRMHTMGWSIVNGRFVPPGDQKAVLTEEFIENNTIGGQMGTMAP